MSELIRAALFIPLLPTVVLLWMALRAVRLKKNAPAGLTRACDAALASRATESLAAAIAFKTVSGDPVCMPELARLRDFLRMKYPLFHAGAEREILSDYSLLFRLPGNNPELEPVLFCAHLDVVPAEDSGWRHPPFSGVTEDGRVYGRGALDCKGIMICLLEAAEKLLSGDSKPERDIYFAFGHDEESGGNGGAGAIARTFMERGLRFHMILDEGGKISKNPLAPDIYMAHIATAEKGMANILLHAAGDSGHASTPPKNTALGRLSEALCRIEFNPRPPRLTPPVKDYLRAAASVAPFGWRFLAANTPLTKRALFRRLSANPETNAMIRSTMAATLCRSGIAHNVLPPKAEATVNARLLSGDGLSGLTAYLNALLGDLGVRAAIASLSEPSSVSGHNCQAFQKIAAAVKDVFGDILITPSLLPFATDSVKYENLSGHVFRFSPFVDTDAGLAHGTDEWVSSAALGSAALFYYELLRSF